MNTRRLRAFLDDLAELRDLVRQDDDERGAVLLDQLINNLRKAAHDADNVLKRLGNPPTDP